MNWLIDIINDYKLTVIFYKINNTYLFTDWKRGEKLSGTKKLCLIKRIIFLILSQPSSGRTFIAKRGSNGILLYHCLSPKRYNSWEEIVVSTVGMMAAWKPTFPGEPTIQPFQTSTHNTSMHPKRIYSSWLYLGIFLRLLLQT